MPKTLAIALLGLFALVPFMGVPAAQSQAPLDPQKVVTLADVETLLEGKFPARVVEPGIVKYEEVNGPRVVEVSLFPGNDLTGLKVTLIGHGEPVEDVGGLGDVAIYRPQGGHVMVEQKNKAGDMCWFEVRVYNVEGADSAAATKRLAIDLARRGVPRL